MNSIFFIMMTEPCMYTIPQIKWHTATIAPHWANRRHGRWFFSIAQLFRFRAYDLTKYILSVRSVLNWFPDRIVAIFGYFVLLHYHRNDTKIRSPVPNPLWTWIFLTYTSITTTFVFFKLKYANYNWLCALKFCAFVLRCTQCFHFGYRKPNDTVYFQFEPGSMSMYFFFFLFSNQPSTINVLLSAAEIQNN